MSSHPTGFRLAQGEHFEICPYNMAHQITNAKIIYHLDKCRQQYKKEMAAKGQNVEIAICRYNHIHQYPKIEMDFHENQKCPDRGSIINTIQYHYQELPEKLAAERAEAEAEAAAAAAAQTQKKKSSKSKNAPPPEPVNDEENWDEEANDDYKAGYDPKQKLESKCFLYHPMGLSKSERKAHRFENRKKYQKEEEEKMAKARGPIPGLNYLDIKKEEADEDDEWEKETVGFPTPRREEPFLDVNIKTESWNDEVDEWETETVARSPVARRFKEEPKPEPEPNYDWEEI